MVDDIADDPNLLHDAQACYTDCSREVVIMLSRAFYPRRSIVNVLAPIMRLNASALIYLQTQEYERSQCIFRVLAELHTKAPKPEFLQITSRSLKKQ